MSETLDVIGEAPVVDTTSSATNNQLSQDLLFNMPIPRTGDQPAELRPRHQRQLGLRRRRQLRQRAAHRRRGHPRSLGRHGLDLLQLQHRRGGPVHGHRRPRGVRRLHGRDREHHHQVGRQPVRGLFDVIYTKSSLASKNVGDAIALEPEPRPGRPRPTSWRTSPPSSAGRSSRQAVLLRQRAALPARPDPTGPRTSSRGQPAASTARSPGSPAPTTTSPPTCSSTTTTSPAARVRQPHRHRRHHQPEDAPEYVWLAQWRHLFGSRTFTEVKYNGWWGFYDLNPSTRTFRTTSTARPACARARRATSTTPTAAATRSTPPSRTTRRVSATTT